jgi:hypothetical protein
MAGRLWGGYELAFAASPKEDLDEVIHFGRRQMQKQKFDTYQSQIPLTFL